MQELRTSIENLLPADAQGTIRSSGITREMAARITGFIAEVMPSAKVLCVFGRLTQFTREHMMPEYLERTEKGFAGSAADPILGEDPGARCIDYPELYSVLEDGDSILSLHIRRATLKAIYKVDPDRFREVFLSGGNEQRISFNDYIGNPGAEKTAAGGGSDLGRYCSLYLPKSEKDIRQAIKMRWDKGTSRNKVFLAITLMLVLLTGALAYMFKKLQALDESINGKTPPAIPESVHKTGDNHIHKVELLPELQFAKGDHLQRMEKKKLLVVNTRHP